MLLLTLSLPIFLRNPGVLRINRARLDSPALRNLRAAGMELSVPLISQEELLGLLNIGPGLSGRKYSGDDRTLLTRIATHAPSALRVALYGTGAGATGA